MEFIAVIAVVLAIVILTPIINWIIRRSAEVKREEEMNQLEKEIEELSVKYEKGKMKKAEKEEYFGKIKQLDDMRASIEIEKEIRERNREYNEQSRINRSTIVKTAIVGSSQDSRKKVGSTVVRGAIGGAVLGPAGLVGGALSGKNKIKNKTTFLIQYADGHRETKEVDNDSAEFDRLCNYLDM